MGEKAIDNPKIESIIHELESLIKRCKARRIPLDRDSIDSILSKYADERFSVINLFQGSREWEYIELKMFFFKIGDQYFLLKAAGYGVALQRLSEDDYKNAKKMLGIDAEERKIEIMWSPPSSKNFDKDGEEYDEDLPEPCKDRECVEDVDSDLWVDIYTIYPDGTNNFGMTPAITLFPREGYYAVAEWDLRDAVFAVAIKTVRGEDSIIEEYYIIPPEEMDVIRGLESTYPYFVKDDSALIRKLTNSMRGPFSATEIKKKVEDLVDKLIREGKMYHDEEDAKEVVLEGLDHEVLYG